MSRSSFAASDAPTVSIIGVSNVAASRGRSLLLSRERVSSSQTIQTERPPRAPPTWPAVLVSLLHNLSMGAALNVWLEVCKEVVGEQDLKPNPDGGESSESQRYYGRLLAANAVCELITSQLVGVMSDKFGRRPIQCLAQLGQVIDYGIAGLCLPTLGIVRQIPAEVAQGLLFCSRGIAGLLGNYKVTLQSYTADISSAEECPDNLAALGGAMVAGMCAGSLIVALVQSMAISFRACYFTAAALNVVIVIVVKTAWRDIAPRKEFRCSEANPVAALAVLGVSRAMVIYSMLVFLSSFGLNMMVSTLDFYCQMFLKMDKRFYILLGMVWAMESLFVLAVVQPFLTRRFGEITTLTFSFTSLSMFYLLFSLLTPSTWTLAYAVITFFAVGSMCYPIAVGLAARELPPQQQGTLQGAMSILETLAKIFAPLLASEVLIPKFKGKGQFHGMVYFVASMLMLPGICWSYGLTKYTTHVDPDKIGTDSQISVEMQ